MTFKFIDRAKKEFPVSRLCRQLAVSESGYYGWRTRPASRRQREDIALSAHVRAAFVENRSVYGSLRLTAELQEQGLAVGRRRVARLMRENNLNALRKRRSMRTTDSHHTLPIAPNLLKQNFSADAPDEKWGADISYVWTAEGWLYLAVVMDLFSRRIVGWSLGGNLHRSLPLKALNRALALRRPARGLIHHSDRGSQYCSHEYRNMLKNNNIQPSMSARGNCYDNAVVETFFKTLKSELVWRTCFMTRDQARREIADYINDFYNPKRRHSALGYMSPNQFERNAP